MSYQSTGSVKDTVLSAAETALRVADDPALPKVVSLIAEVNKLTQDDGTESYKPGERGIGLRKLVKPLEAYVTYKRHPWLLPVLVGGVVLTIFALGAKTGRLRRHS